VTTVDVSARAQGAATQESRAAERQERLTADVAELRGRRGLAALVAGDRWMLVLGGVLLPLGLLLVLLGWLGASRTVLVFEQLPYLISGGLLGVALVVAGGFVYFAYWLTLLVRESRRGREELAAALARVEVLLADAAARPVAGAAADGTAAPGAHGPGRLVATRTGTMLHRAACQVVAGREGLREVAPDAPGFTPCRICEPLSD
jgi:hypothetical protein